MTSRPNDPLEAEPVPHAEGIPLGPAHQSPPPRDTYAHRATSQPAGQPTSSAQPQPPTLDYGRRGHAAWEFWTRQWWTRPRHLMAAGLAMIGLGWGMTLTYWPVPPVLIAAGAFLVGMALPLREEM